MISGLCTWVGRIGMATTEPPAPITDLGVQYCHGRVALIRVKNAPATGQYVCTELPGGGSYQFAAGDRGALVEINCIGAIP